MWPNIKCLYGSPYDCSVCLDVKCCKETNVKRLLRDGRSRGEIAEHFGVSVVTIRRNLPRKVKV